MAKRSKQPEGLLARIEALGQADTGTWLHIASVIGMLFIGAGLGFVVLIGLGRVEVAAARQLASRPPTLVIEWPRLSDNNSATTWMPETLRAELQALVVSRVRTDDPLSSDSLDRIGEALSMSGWFEGNPIVRRTYKEQVPIIHISGTWRAPVAVVRYEELDYLVAAGGRLLPARYTAGTSGMPVLVGATEPPPTIEPTGALAFGKPWGGREVLAGLDLLNLMTRLPFAHQVAAVDVSHHAQSGQLELVTDRQTRVLWGGPPSKPLPGELRTEGKVALLLDIVRRYGRIDAGQERIEIYTDRVVIDRTSSRLASVPSS